MVRHNSSQAAERHASNASSGAESWTSQDTIRGMFGARRHTPVNIATDNGATRYVLEANLLFGYRSLFDAKENQTVHVGIRRVSRHRLLLFSLCSRWRFFARVDMERPPFEDGLEPK
jgi:hypothetical protein